jgi:hypothetical protein
MKRSQQVSSLLLSVSLAAASSAVLGACDVPVQSLGDTLDTVRVETSQPLTSNAIDIIFVIDNSGSMSPYQSELTARFNELIDILAGLRADFHLAVITTDSSSPTQSGRFLDRPWVCDESQTPDALAYCADLDLQQPFLAANRYENPDRTFDTERLQREFACLATQGTRGSSVEKGLRALGFALSPDLLSGPNRDFLRDDALLAIIFLTDEEDCSQVEIPGTSVSDDCYDGNLRASMRPVREFFDQVVALKNGDPSRVLVSAIMGDDDGVQIVEGIREDDLPPACTAPVRDGSPPPSSNPRDGERYREFLSLFGSNAVETSICDDTFTPALRRIGGIIRANLEFNCLNTPPETCRTADDCADGVDCINPGEPGGNKFCADFEVLVEVSAPETPFTFTPLVSPGSAGQTEPNPGAQYEVSFDALRCSTGIAFSFLEGARPSPGARFRATYPIAIDSTTVGEVLGSEGEETAQ